MPWTRNEWPNSVWPCELCGRQGGLAFEREYRREEAGGDKAEFCAFVCDECASHDEVPKTFLDELVTRHPRFLPHVAAFVAATEAERRKAEPS